MSRDRYRRDRGIVDPAEQPRSERGLPLCRYCGKECAPPRRTFCSKTCVHQWKIETQPVYARKCVEARDKGICAGCGIDTKRLYHELKLLEYDDPVLLTERLDAFGMTDKQWERRKTLWDMDHVVPVEHGGGSCGLDNLQTLCVKCHSIKSRAYAQTRARYGGS